MAEDKTSDDWKTIKKSEEKTSLPKGQGNFPVNGVDLTANLPVPKFYTFTDDQQKAFAEFRKTSKMCTEQHSDYYISRFLVARKWKMDASVELFDNAIKWRQEQGIDNILETFPDNYWYKVLMEYWPNSINPGKYHWTKDKCPIFYERIGLVHPKLCDIIPRETLLKHHIYCIELLERENHRIAAENKFSPGTILVEDLGALTATHLAHKVKALISEISVSDEQRNPESIRKIYIVNPPGIFGFVWAFVKPFMEEQTLQKFSFGTPKDFAAEWEAIIGKENIPKFLDGSLDWDPPKGGSPKGLIPKELVKVEIGTGKDASIEVQAKKGQVVHWQVMCDRDIRIGLFVKTGSDVKKDRKAVAAWPVKKYDEDNSPHHGWHTAEEDSTFIVYLDNTDSYIRSRKVKYFTYVKDPLVPKAKKLEKVKSDKPKVEKSKSKKEKK